MPPLTYQAAGLNLDLYNEAMSRLPALMKKTHTPRVQELQDGFAGLFRLGNSRKFSRNYKDPVLVSGTDGVGTKIKVAIQAGIFDTVGIDLVAMSVNDCLCLGAEPLFFLDYLALPQDDPDRIAQIVSGVCRGCEEAGAALLGGETAIMPDLYAAGDFDLAGFCVAVVERKEIIDGKLIEPGDVLLGLTSSGFHSNGYSLVRKAVFDQGQLQGTDSVPELGRTVFAALLEPTKIYVRPVLEVLGHRKTRSAVTGLAHITGGGLADNIERILPAGCQAIIDRQSWEPGAVFPWLQRLGEIDREEMYRVFNMGIGFVLIVRPKGIDKVQERFASQGISASIIGRIEAGEKSARCIN